jgi:hypothetical protein
LDVDAADASTAFLLGRSQRQIESGIYRFGAQRFSEIPQFAANNCNPARVIAKRVATL